MLDRPFEPMAFSFDYIPSEPGRREFYIRARPVEAVEEMIAEDNESKVSVDIPCDLSSRRREKIPSLLDTTMPPSPTDKFLLVTFKSE